MSKSWHNMAGRRVGHAYPTYTSVSRLVGAEIFNYDLTEDGGWMPDFEALERLPLDRIKLMWINYPHMPTGTPASVGLFEKIVDFAAAMA